MSPRTPKQFEEIREEKRTLIMDTALTHFADEGYHNTSISHIAKHAGISKGLMYNYFKSKEELLDRIVYRSMEDIFSHFDPDHDGNLSDDEFEMFVRIITNHIRENLSFWRLLFQLLLQKDVRERFLNSYLGSPGSLQELGSESRKSVMGDFIKLMQDYFVRKKDKKPAGYDPMLELNMFIYTLEGFTVVNSYLDEVDIYYDITVNRIIELYK